ncbi:MAG: potassium transporter TrkH [Deltaproteobacteria bacterium]|nr:potassium transporter TrkH [Deltaproteobacteria bacterium]
MSWTARISGPLLTLGPLALTAAAVLRAVPGTIDWTWGWPLAVAAAAIISLAGLAFAVRPSVGRIAASIGCAGFVAQAIAPLLSRPGLALVVLMLVAAVVAAVWRRPSQRSRGTGETQASAADSAQPRIAALLALCSWILAVIGRVASQPPVIGAVAFGLLAALAIGVARLTRERRGRPRLRRYLLLALGALSVAASIAAYPSWLLVLASLAIGPIAVLVLTLPDDLIPTGTTSWWEPLVAQPGRLLVVTFFALCSIGALALSLPVCAGRAPIDVLDAAFTAVSAVCVTGLVVLDTELDFSTTGQVVILALIQLGGLGIMTLTTAALAALGRRLSLKTEGAVAGLVSHEDRGVLFRALRQLLAVTAVCEALGALVLATLFLVEGDSVGMALWRGLFTSISAFCNAGFSLQGDNLVPYQTNAGVLHAVAALIVLGGLSPPVIVAAPDWVRRRHVGLHIKLALTVTMVLLVGGWIAIAAFEWDNTLVGLSIADRLHNAWFQSVTTRTAGFNTIDIAAIRSPTVWIMVLLMFIGGSPGSTAGGIKITTLAVLVLTFLGVLRGRAGAFGRSLQARVVLEAVAITLAAVMVALAALCVLLLTQQLSSERALFEVISAVGTVGLSMNVTPMLDGIGKIVVILCMFAGRIGPLTLLLVLFGRRPDTAWQLPEDEVKVG